MGWASLLEDSQELKEHWAAITGTINSLRQWPLDSRYSTPTHASFRTEDLAARAQRLISDLESMLDKVYEAAEARLRDPGFRLVRKLDKRTFTLQTCRAELERAEQDLEHSRKGSDRLRTENRDLKAKLAVLQAERDILAAQVADRRSWQDEISGIKRLRT